MKKILIALLFLSFFLLYIFKVHATSISFPLLAKTIIIDPGHGGKDGGAESDGVKEKDINLSISMQLKEQIENLGGNVILTRSGDYDLSEDNASRRKKSDFDNRIKLINTSGANLYLSIHINKYLDSKYYGPQVFYTPNIKSNNLLANFIQQRLNNFAKTNRIEKPISFTYMYKRLTIPGVLIECGFISNKNEKNKLLNKEYQKRLSQFIVSGIIDYFNS